VEAIVVVARKVVVVDKWGVLERLAPARPDAAE